MADTGTRTHHLHVARFRASFVAQAVLVGDGAFAHVGNDFPVFMRMRRKTRARLNGIVVPDPQRAPMHAPGIVVFGKGEVMLGIEPAVVGSAEALEGATFDQWRPPNERG